MKIIVFGYHNIGYSCLKLLIDAGEEVVGVITYDDNPNENIWFKSVEELAQKNNIKVFKPSTINTTEFIEINRNLKPDIIFSFYFRDIIPKEILEIPPKGCLNMHGSFLPAYRGRVPVNWAIINGEKETGVTLHYMIEKPDAGDIAAQKKVEISFTDTAKMLFDKMENAAVEVLKETLPLLRNDSVKRIKQDDSKTSYYGGRTLEDGIIEWSKSAFEIYNLVRAVTKPYPGAFTFYKGQKIFIWWCSLSESNNNNNSKLPGTILNITDDNKIIVNTGKGILKIEKYTIENDGKANFLVGEHFGK